MRQACAAPGLGLAGPCGMRIGGRGGPWPRGVPPEAPQSPGRVRSLGIGPQAPRSHSVASLATAMGVVRARVERQPGSAPPSLCGVVQGVDRHPHARGCSGQLHKWPSCRVGSTPRLCPCCEQARLRARLAGDSWMGDQRGSFSAIAQLRCQSGQTFQCSV